MEQHSPWLAGLWICSPLNNWVHVFGHFPIITDGSTLTTFLFYEKLGFVESMRPNFDFKRLLNTEYAIFVWKTSLCSRRKLHLTKEICVWLVDQKAINLYSRNSLQRELGLPPTFFSIERVLPMSNELIWVKENPVGRYYSVFFYLVVSWKTWCICLDAFFFIILCWTKAKHFWTKDVSSSLLLETR